MEYNVYHMKKKAIFRLGWDGSKDDTFGYIKEKIADYFGWVAGPVEKIFLMNDKD